MRTRKLSYFFGDDEFVMSLLLSGPTWRAVGEFSPSFRFIVLALVAENDYKMELYAREHVLMANRQFAILFHFPSLRHKKELRFQKWTHTNVETRKQL